MITDEHRRATDKMHIIIDDKNTPITPIIDAEHFQRDRFRLRDQK